ncbi:MAG: AI-2E family transporter [Clostridia bacterium]|nr:AI-2E family transporter [Clostridia bacterium]
MKVEWKTLWKTGFVIFVFCLLWKYMDYAHNLISLIIGALTPLFIGAVIAFLLNIIMNGFEKIIFTKTSKPVCLKIRRPLCLILAIVALIAIISAVIGIVVPQLTDCIELIINLFPKAVKWIIGKLDNLEIVPENIINLLNSTDWQSKIDQIVEVVTSGIGSTVQIVVTTLSSVISGIVTAFLSIIFAFYLLISKSKLQRQSKRVISAYLPERLSHKILYVCSVFSETFRKYIIGQCTEALILGVLCIIGMLILRIPYAAMIGTLIAFTALIPIAGAYIGAAVGALMIVTVSPIKALIFLIFLVILQQIEGNLIYPKVVGSSIGLPGIWVLAAVTVGGAVMGIPGMLLGVPLTASLYRILRHDLNKRAPKPVNEKPKETPKTESPKSTSNEEQK